LAKGGKLASEVASLSNKLQASAVRSKTLRATLDATERGAKTALSMARKAGKSHAMGAMVATLAGVGVRVAVDTAASKSASLRPVRKWVTVGTGAALALGSDSVFKKVPLVGTYGKYVGWAILGSQALDYIQKRLRLEDVSVAGPENQIPGPPDVPMLSASTVPGGQDDLSDVTQEEMEQALKILSNFTVSGPDDGSEDQERSELATEAAKEIALGFLPLAAIPMLANASIPLVKAVISSIRSNKKQTPAPKPTNKPMPAFTQQALIHQAVAKSQQQRRSMPQTATQRASYAMSQNQDDRQLFDDFLKWRQNRAGISGTDVEIEGPRKDRGNADMFAEALKRRQERREERREDRQDTMANALAGKSANGGHSQADLESAQGSDRK